MRRSTLSRSYPVQFTLDTYVHLLEEALPEPVSLEVELAGVSGGSVSVASGGWDELAASAQSSL